MQYVGNASIDDNAHRVVGVVLTAAPGNLAAFLEYANEEIDQPWVKVVGEALEPHGERAAAWVGAFVPVDGDLADSEDATGRSLALEVWEERHAAEVVERITLPNGRGFYILQGDDGA